MPKPILGGRQKKHLNCLIPRLSKQRIACGFADSTLFMKLYYSQYLLHAFFVIRSWWGTTSNAFEKSIKIASSCPLSLITSEISLVISASWVTVDRPDRKPCCRLYSKLFLSKCVMIALKMMCSNILQHVLVSETGR